MTTPSPGATSALRYWAFISYAHEDRKEAQWLHRRLESFRVPTTLQRPVADDGLRHDALRPIFIDRLELASSSDLSSSIEAALNDSAYLICVCTPRSAGSSRVAAEVSYFQAARGPARVYPLLVDGRPNAVRRGGAADEECLPPPLRLDDGGDPSRREPLAADIRKGRGSRDEAVARIVAGMLGVGLDTIRQRESQRRQRRLRWITTAACTVAALAVGLSVYVWRLRDAAVRSEQRAVAEAQAARTVTDFMVGVFRVSDPSESLGNVVRVRDLLDAGAAQIESGVPGGSQVQGQLMRTIGTVYRQLGLYDKARPLLEQALVKSRGLTPPDPTEVSESLFNLALLNGRTDRREVADAQLRESLGYVEPCEVHYTACALRYLALGRLHMDENRVADAKADLERAMALELQGGRRDTAVVARVLDTLGHVHREQADFAQAERQSVAALEMRRRLHGETHPDVAKSHYALALLYQEQRKPEAAMAHAQKAIAIDEQVYGPEHPESLTSLQLMGILYAEKGEFEKALPYFQKTLEGRIRIYGPEHTDVGYAAYNLGYLFGDMKRYDDAIDLMLKSQEIWEKSQGPEHPDVAYALDQRGEYLLKKGRVDEAEPLIERALAINTKSFESNHPNVARSQLNLARVRLAQGQHAQARDLVNSALVIQADKYGADSDVVTATHAEFDPLLAR